MLGSVGEMSVVADPNVDEPGPPTASDDTGGDEPREPWWHQPWRLLVLGAALLLLGGIAGWALTSRSSSPPGAGSVDVGFLQDMRWHHDQAVRMGLIMLDKPASAQDPIVRQLASDIVQSQQFETGVMAGQLRAWGQPEANESGTGMAWMGTPFPIDRMPGMASEAEIQQLKDASGRAADVLFLKLMAAHHEGGLHMASYAEASGHATIVRQLAASILTGQQSELVELHNNLVRLGAA